MGKKGFDLGALARQAMGQAGAVSDSDTMPTLTLIPYADIRPDPDNDYSMDGIEELAGNIETVGLLDPLVVLPETNGVYPLLSGHRRHAAIGKIIEGGSEQFAAGVPVIIRDVSRAGGDPKVVELFDRLTLLLANADNRKKTSADINREAERLEAIVAELADLGFNFPGRRRDWVAELSGLSRSKLARLKVIREKLDPSIRKPYYDTGKLSEDAAYKLAQLPVEHQRRTVDFLLNRTENPASWYANTIENYGADLARLNEYTCPEKLGGGACTNREQLMAQIWPHGYRHYCYCAYRANCCHDCSELAWCRNVCMQMKPKADKLRADKREENKKQKAVRAEMERTATEQIRAIWMRFGDALTRANMTDETLREITEGKVYINPNDIRRLESGDDSVKVNMSTPLPFRYSCHIDELTNLIKTADALGCSLDYLLLRTDVPEVNRGQGDSETEKITP